MIDINDNMTASNTLIARTYNDIKTELNTLMNIFGLPADDMLLIAFGDTAFTDIDTDAWSKHKLVVNSVITVCYNCSCKHVLTEDGISNLITAMSYKLYISNFNLLRLFVDSCCNHAAVKSYLSVHLLHMVGYMIYLQNRLGKSIDDVANIINEFPGEDAFLNYYCGTATMEEREEFIRHWLSSDVQQEILSYVKLDVDEFINVEKMVYGGIDKFRTECSRDFEEFLKEDDSEKEES